MRYLLSKKGKTFVENVGIKFEMGRACSTNGGEEECI
jgi:hypothetical protein